MFLIGVEMQSFAEMAYNLILPSVREIRNHGCCMA